MVMTGGRNEKLLPDSRFGRLAASSDSFRDRENLRYLKIDYFDEGAAIKSLHYADYRAVGNSFYPFQMIMESQDEDQGQSGRFLGP